MTWLSPFHVGDRLVDFMGYKGTVIAERRDGELVWVRWDHCEYITKVWPNEALTMRTIWRASDEG